MGVSMEKTDRVYAYAGKILRINLGNGSTTVEPTLKYAREWLGGPGIAVKLLYDELRAWVTPYEPANRLVLGAGPLMGTTAPGACKSNMSTLGPVTGGWASSCSDSYTGGELKYAGYDSIVIEGRAHTPVYLWICDDRIELRDAAHLWGKTTWETLDGVRKELRIQRFMPCQSDRRREPGSWSLCDSGPGQGLWAVWHRGGHGLQKSESHCR